VVNHAPVVLDVSAVSCESVDSGRQVTLHVEAVDEEGDALVRYVWDMQDGSDRQEEEQDTFTYVFPPDQDEATVVLEVYDERGGMTQVAVPIDLSNCIVLLKAADDDCGCENIRIWSRFQPDEGGTSYWTATYCAPNGTEMGPACGRAGAVADRECGRGQFAYRCKTGPVAPDAPRPLRFPNKFGWSFEVGAVLTSESRDLSKCTQGQFARGSNTVRAIIQGVEVTTDTRAPEARASPRATDPLPTDRDWNLTIVNGPDGVPSFEDPNPNKFGADNYTQPFLSKRHFSNRLWMWIDAPTVTFRPEVFYVKQRAQFVSFVTGGLGSCWCRYEIQHEWSVRGGRTAVGGGAAPTRVRRIAGHNCTIDGD
jgi:hypothetical protein